MRKLLFLLINVLLIGTVQAQYVGIGTTSPVNQLTVIGVGSNPSIPGVTSTGVLRIGISVNEGIDIGKMSVYPYAGWIQAGIGGVIADPLSLQLFGGRVGIGTNAPQAALDINSTNEGFLPPRMTFVQRNAISDAVAGLEIWCTDCSAPGEPGELEVFNGTKWTNMCGGAAGVGTVTICSQIWMTKNLDVSNYRNGDPIPNVTDPTAWAALTTGAWCWYNNDSASYAATYGKLYNWYAYFDPRGLAPLGWHVAADAEWSTLLNCVGGTFVAGGPLKEAGTAHWESPNTGATNSSGFTALPGSYRLGNGSWAPSVPGQKAEFWGSAAAIGTAHVYEMTFLSADVSKTNIIDQCGFSIRCVRD